MHERAGNADEDVFVSQSGETGCRAGSRPNRRWANQRPRGASFSRLVLWTGGPLTLSLILSLAPNVLAGGPATAALKASIDALVMLLENPELKKPERQRERRERIEKIVGERFNYEEMSKRTLPSEWKKLSEADRQEFVTLFQQLLSASYASKIEGYSGEQVVYINERREGDYAEVRTRVTSGKADIPLDYRLLSRSGEWRVYDVVVDGVSLVNNYRGQFTKILRESSYPELVKQLREKVEKNSGQSPS